MFGDRDLSLGLIPTHGVRASHWLKYTRVRSSFSRIIWRDGRNIVQEVENLVKKVNNKLICL